MFGNNLKNIRKQKGFTQTTLAKALSDITGTKIEKGNVAKWENGTNPKLNIIESLSIVLNTPEQYFFDSSSEKIKKIISNFKPGSNELINNVKQIPLITQFKFESDIKKFIQIDKSLIDKNYEGKNIQAIEVVGDSMKPYVSSGDIILFIQIEKNTFLNFPDGKYIIETINGLQLKNLSFKIDGNIIISSENPNYSYEEVKRSDFQKLLEIKGIAIGRILKN